MRKLFIPTHVKLTENGFLCRAAQIAMSVNVIMFDRKCNIKLLKSMINVMQNVTQSKVSSLKCVRVILHAWFDHLKESFSYIRSTVQIVLPPAVHVF